MLEYYLRKGDPLSPVYEVDTSAKAWRLAASRVGAVPELCGHMPDDGGRFRSDKFERVWPKCEDGSTITYTREKPTMTPDQAQQARLLLSAVRDVLLAAKGVAARGAEMLVGTDGAALLHAVENDIGTFVANSPALIAARAAANLAREHGGSQA